MGEEKIKMTKLLEEVRKRMRWMDVEREKDDILETTKSDSVLDIKKKLQFRKL